MKPVIAIVAVFLILGIVPFLILLVGTDKEIRETRRKIKQNEKDIRRMIYGDLDPSEHANWR